VDPRTLYSVRNIFRRLHPTYLEYHTDVVHTQYKKATSGILAEFQPFQPIQLLFYNI
jgi:hypothetical protein